MKPRKVVRVSARDPPADTQCFTRSPEGHEGTEVSHIQDNKGAQQGVLSCVEAEVGPGGVRMGWSGVLKMHAGRTCRQRTGRAPPGGEQHEVSCAPPAEDR